MKKRGIGGNESDGFWKTKEKKDDPHSRNKLKQGECFPETLSRAQDRWQEIHM